MKHKMKGTAYIYLGIIEGGKKRMGKAIVHSKKKQKKKKNHKTRKGTILKYYTF